MGRDPVPTFCPLCVSRCGARADVSDGTLLALHPDPSHPTGKAICLKGKAAPEIVYHRSRLFHSLRRTRPKGVAEPEWERITWDEALDTVAERLQAAAAADGPESVAFSSSSPSTSAISDAVDIVFAQHGWWQACDELGLPGYAPYGPDSANLNLVLRQTPSDPISGSSPLRASVCDVSLLSAAAANA